MSKSLKAKQYQYHLMSFTPRPQTSIHIKYLLSLLNFPCFMHARRWRSALFFIEFVASLNPTPDKQRTGSQLMDRPLARVLLRTSRRSQLMATEDHFASPHQSVQGPKPKKPTDVPCFIAPTLLQDT